MAEQQVQLTDLDPVQLQEVKKQLDQELEHLTSSYQQLKSAQAKFKACVNDLQELKPGSKGGYGGSRRWLVTITATRPFAWGCSPELVLLRVRPQTRRQTRREVPEIEVEGWSALSSSPSNYLTIAPCTLPGHS
ncbi:subunit of tubulin prefoldin [Saitozyma podzolica]|uniref:Subunit of tubulin prefoldin n=1 Tax=Saitozyma podzolica TaxID=1890683 RepID=A0A427YHJ5_9TREE|nr:subunit of tubulin prefoldin [Saitozyma podzolica]